MASSTLSSALSSMEVMLDALMQRGIGKPEEKPKEEAPPALPTRPTVRGRLPSLQRPGVPAPWAHRPPPLPPSQEEEEKCAVNLELERRAMVAEEAVREKDDVVRQKDDEIASLRQQVEHYESRLSECEARMRSVEEELQKQITTLQIAQSNAGRSGGSSMATRHRHDLSGSTGAGKEASSVTRHQPQQPPRAGEPVIVAVDERQTEAVNRLATELRRESEAFEHGARAVVATDTRPPGAAKSVDELKRLKRQFGAWKKEYEARLRKTKAELKKLVRSERGGQGHGNGTSRRRCCSWRISCKMPKCRLPKWSCAIKLPSCAICCCFRRCC
uniref:Uncharacterized protein n=1 Tax=Leersia perrieri TaxID=77586 RepID=A0A0D9XRM0_9ORYZ